MIYWSIGTTDILVPVVIKENFKHEQLPVFMSLMKSASGIGTFIQS